MITWNELIKRALLGTEKMALPEDLLPVPVHVLVGATSDSDREARFYKVAALSFVYERAGRLPKKSGLPAIPPAPKEARDFCPAGYVAVLKKLFQEENPRSELLGLCFDKIAGRGFVLPSNVLVRALNLGTQPLYKNLRDKIRVILGERGKWMQQFNPAWQYGSPTDTNAVWQEGTSSGRRLYLSELRLNEPEKAFDLLRQTWPVESGRERKEFLKILQVAPRPEETVFVEDIFDNIMANKDERKQINLEIRKLCVEILLTQTNSTLYKTLTAGLQKYIVAPKTIPGLRSKKTLSLPGKEDDFLCAGLMSQYLGFDEISTLPGVPEPSFWCCELLRSLHPAAWENLISADWQEIFTFFSEAEAGQKKARLPLLQHLSHALARSRYRSGIVAYLKQYSADDSNYFMLQVLTRPELEAYTLRHIGDGQVPVFLRDSLQQPGWVWSKTLSRALLTAFTGDNPGGFHYHEFGKILPLGMHFELSMITDLYEKANQETKDWQKQMLRNQLIMPLLRMMEKRRDIENMV